jgi:hypothetical protein
LAEFFGMGMQPRPEERPTAEPGPMNVFLNGLGGGVMQTNGPALIAFFAQAQSGLKERVSSRGSEDSRAMNWECAGFGTTMGNRSSAAESARYL